MASNALTPVVNVFTPVVNVFTQVADALTLSLLLFNNSLIRFKSPLLLFNNSLIWFKSPLLLFNNSLIRFKSPLLLFNNSLIRFKKPLLLLLTCFNIRKRFTTLSLMEFFRVYNRIHLTFAPTMNQFFAQLAKHPTVMWRLIMSILFITLGIVVFFDPALTVGLTKEYRNTACGLITLYGLYRFLTFWMEYKKIND